MLSHLSYPSLDRSAEPATFSRRISTDILRGEYRYRGLVITDDLQMQGSRQLLRPEVGALRALQAGADIVMLTWSFADQRKAFEYVKDAVRSGALPLDEVHQKLQRILKTKAFANLYRRDPNMSPLVRGFKLTSKDYSDLESHILDKNLQINLTTRRALSEKSRHSRRRPASHADRFCVMSPNQAFIRSFIKFSKVEVMARTINSVTNHDSVLSWSRGNRCSVTIAAVTGVKTARLFRSLPQNEQRNIIMVNLGAPRLIPEKNSFLRVINLYFNHAESGKKIAERLEEILKNPANSYVQL